MEVEENDDENDGSDNSSENLPYSLYICPYNSDNGNSIVKKLAKSDFEKIIEKIEPVGQWSVTETGCGLLVYFANDADRVKLMKCELNREINCPVQVAKFTNNDTSGYTAVIKNLPFSIPLQDISKALENQGITPLSVERLRQTVKVKLADVKQYESLVRDGLNFFGVSRFPVANGKWPSLLFTSNHQQHESVLQCYRCQGFWHLAVNCEQPPCCVRCGGAHSVVFCPTPRNSPTCCHCGGPHHAAYKHCPVRKELVNSTPVSLTLSTSLKKNYN